MNEIKLIFVNRFFHPDHSATSQLLTDLAFDLAREGINVQVVTSRFIHDAPAKLLSAAEVIEGVGVTRVWSSRLGRGHLAKRAIDYFTFYLSAGWAVWKSADRDTVVIAKTDPPLLSVLLSPIVRMRRARLINWLQDLFPEIADVLGVPGVKGPVLSALRVARNATLRSATTNVVVGEQMKGFVLKQGVSEASVQIIHNWADSAEIFPVSPDRNPLRDDWCLGGRFVAGYSGNLGRAHEFETILRAAEDLRDHPEIAFLFIGGGGQRQSVQDECRRRRLENVQFRPYQPRERLSQSLSAADVHLVSLNPLLEGLVVPSKVYGVMAAARPILFIGDQQGEVSTLLRRAMCGEAIATGDSVSLAAAILKLAADRELSAALGKNARHALESAFDRRHAIQSWKALITSK